MLYEWHDGGTCTLDDTCPEGSVLCLVGFVSTVCSDGMGEYFQYLLQQGGACRIEDRSLASASNTDCDSDSSDGVPTECVVDVVQQVTVD